MMRKLTLTFSMLVLTVAFLAAAPASADTLNLTLDNPVQSGTPGSTLDFTATVSAPATNGAAVSLASDSFNVDFPLTMNDDGFFLGFPLSLDAGDSFSGLLFSVTLPPDVAQGSYTGFFSILDDSGNILSTADFQVNSVPEPGTIILLTTGLSGLALVVRRRQYV